MQDFDKKKVSAGYAYGDNWLVLNGDYGMFRIRGRMASAEVSVDLPQTMTLAGALRRFAEIAEPDAVETDTPLPPPAVATPQDGHVPDWDDSQWAGSGKELSSSKQSCELVDLLKHLGVPWPGSRNNSAVRTVGRRSIKYPDLLPEMAWKLEPMMPLSASIKYPRVFSRRTIAEILKGPAAVRRVGDLYQLVLEGD